MCSINIVKILPLNLNYHNLINFRKSETKPQVAPTLKLQPPLAVDTVSFKANHSNDMTMLKKLLAYKIPDMYSGKIMINPAEVESMMQAHIFSSPLKTLVKVLSKFEESLFPVEQKIFEMLRHEARINPDYTLEEAMHKKTGSAMAELIPKQLPILDELKEKAKNLPEDKKQAFEDLMDLTYKRLFKEKVLLPFSSKDLRYKLERAYQGIRQRGITSEINTMRTLIGIAKTIPEKTTNTKVKARKHKKKNSERDNAKIIAGKMRQMAKILSFSPLEKDKEINEILNNARAKLYNIPLAEPFKRKNFIKELKQLLAGVSDQKLVRSLEQTAIQLPTAKHEPAAFIVKSATSSSEKIGYDLLSRSIGTVEHLLPQTHGGEDYWSNLALATSEMNSERAHRKMPMQLQKHPETYENCQKYVDRLIELHKNKILKKFGLGEWYIINFAEKMYKMSPPDKRMVLDLSKLSKTSKRPNLKLGGKS